MPLQAEKDGDAGQWLIMTCVDEARMTRVAISVNPMSKGARPDRC